MNDYLRRHGPVRTLASAGGLLAAVGVLLAIIPLDHGTIPQWNGLCNSGLGQLGQLLDTSARQDCGAVGLADHAIGWLIGFGTVGLAAALVLAVIQYGTAGQLPSPAPAESLSPQMPSVGSYGQGMPSATGPVETIRIAPGPVSPRAGSARRLAVIAVVCALLGAGVAWAAVSRADSRPQLLSFLCWNGAGDNAATLLQWPAGSVVSGTYRDAALTGTAPDEQMNTDSGALTGTINGTQATLDLGGNGQMYGTLTSALTLRVPQADGSLQPVVCKPGNAAGWNHALAELSRQVTTDNAIASQQQQQQAANAQITQTDQQLASDIATLTQDATALNSDKTLANDVQQMRNDFATEQQDYQTELSDTCLNKSGDADTVSGDADTVGGDLDTLQGDIQTLQSDNVQSDLSAVQSDADTVTNLGATPDPNPAAAIKTAKTALQNLANAIAWATSQGNALNTQAQNLASKAQTVANC
jgi:hypothetical protein